MAPGNAMERSDLLALDEEKLVVLATAGLVRSAARQLAEGRGPSIRVEEDRTVLALLGDVSTRLVPGECLRHTPCDCGSPLVCRHRVMAVLAYRARFAPDERAAPEPWSPGRFHDDELEARLARRAWLAARRAREAGFVAVVARGSIPAVELSACTVRFLVPAELAYARCDCAMAVKCEHVALAVWATRRADARGLDAPRVTVEVGDAERASHQVLDAPLEIARRLLLEGVVRAEGSLGSSFAGARASLESAGYLWPLGVLEDLEGSLEAYCARAASYRAERVGELLTELHARALSASAEAEVPARAILGTDESAEVPLERLRLVSLGVRLVRGREAEGRARVRADVYLADPDTLTVMVLDRSWDLLPGEATRTLARRQLQRGVPLGTLARGQMVTTAARRRANRRLVLGRAGRGRTSVTPQRGDWDLFAPPLFAASYRELARHLRERVPSFVRPRHVADRVHVLAIHAVDKLSYSSSEQTLRSEVVDRHGARARIELTHSAAAPGALDALANALSVSPRFVSGEVRRTGSELVITPLAAVTDRVIALDLEDVSASERALAHLPSSRALGATHPLEEALAEACACLDALAHQGLLHASASSREDLLACVARLRDVGSTACSERVLALGAALAGGDVAEARPLADAWLDASLRVRLASETD